MSDEERTIGVHECPADGSFHENSADCACRPTRADGGTRWIHHGAPSAWLRDAMVEASVALIGALLPAAASPTPENRKPE